MSGPDPNLMRAYGTEDLYIAKQADGTASMALRLASALLAVGAVNKIQNRMARAQIESFERNRALRTADVPYVRAMAAIPAQHTRAPVLVAPMLPGGGYGNVGAFPDMPVGMDEGMVRMASAIGEDFASMEKEALGVGEMLGAFKGLGGKISSGVRGLKQKTLGFLTKPPPVPKPPGTVASPASANSRAFTSLSPEARQAKIQERAARMSKNRVAQGKGGFAETASTVMNKSFGTPAKTMGTIGGLALLGGGAYLGAKALGGASRVMSEENEPTDWGHQQQGAPQLAYGVNQYGYAQRGTPFVY